MATLTAYEVLYDINIANPTQIVNEPVSVTDITKPVSLGESKRAFIVRTVTDIVVIDHNGAPQYQGTHYTLAQTQADQGYSRIYSTPIYSEIYFQNPGDYTVVSYKCCGSYVQASLMNAVTTNIKTIVDDNLTAINDTLTAISIKDATQDSAITNIESSIGVLTAGIASHTATLQNHSDHLNQIDIKDAAQDSAISDINTDISNLDGRVTTLETDVGVIQTNMITLTDDVNDALIAVNDIGVQVVSLDTRMTAAETANTNQDAAILALQTLTGGQTTAITDLITNVNTLNNTTNTHTNQISNLQSADTGFDNRITALEDNDALQDDRLYAIETLDTTQNGRLDAVESTNTTQDNRLTAIENQEATWNDQSWGTITSKPTNITNVETSGAMLRSANDYTGLSTKATPAAADKILIEDTEDGFSKKIITIGSISPAGMMISPGSAVINNIVLFNSSTGTVTKDSGYSIGNNSGQVPISNSTQCVGLFSQKAGQLNNTVYSSVSLKTQILSSFVANTTQELTFDTLCTDTPDDDFIWSCTVEYSSTDQNIIITARTAANFSQYILLYIGGVWGTWKQILNSSGQAPSIPTASTSLTDMPSSLVGQAGKFLQVNTSANGYILVTVSSIGDVTGPSSSTINHIVVFDTSTGKAIADGGIPVSALVRNDTIPVFSGGSGGADGGEIRLLAAPTGGGSNVVIDIIDRKIQFSEITSTNGAYLDLSTLGAAIGSRIVTETSNITAVNTLLSSGEVQSTYINSFRMIQGNYGSFFRQDGANLYLMLTNSGDQYGSFNAYRPINVDLATGVCNISGNAATASNASALGGLALGTTASTVAYINSSGVLTAPTINASSSVELKKDIHIYDGSAVDILNEVELYSFRFKETPQTLRIGILAENVKNALISSGVSQDIFNCVNLLIKAVQEIDNRLVSIGV